MTLLGIIVLLGLAWGSGGRPVGREVLAGQDFLEVLMRSNERADPGYHQLPTSSSTLATTHLPTTELTEPPLTTTPHLETEPPQVVSVRVSSSVRKEAVHEVPVNAIQRTELSVDTSDLRQGNKNDVVPVSAAVQRSEFAVESPEYRQEKKVHEVPVSAVHFSDLRQDHKNDVVPVSVAQRSEYSVDNPGYRQDKRDAEDSVAEASQDFVSPAETNESHDESLTSVSTVTSESRVFYGEPKREERHYEPEEQNYEVDEAISVMSNGRSHGVQTESPKSRYYVLEGRNFRKYRVEEKTPDGFIVGEYGVVSHDDGGVRGVRYTADGNINPRLIYEALVKFLSLK